MPSTSSSKLISNEDVDGAKLLLFSKLDEVKRPERKGLNLFMYNIREADLNEFRRSCLETTAEDIAEVCQKYLKDPIEKDQTSKVIFGSKDNNLEGMVSRGWKIDKFANELSYNESNYDN